MKIGIKVGDIMTRDFISVKPETNLEECAKKMMKKRVGSLILTENKKLKGILTERDIIWAITKKSSGELKKIQAKDLVRKKIVTISPSSDLYDALRKMKKSNYRWLPVLVNGKIIGFLTLKDILKIEPSLFEIVYSHKDFEIREEGQKLKRKNLRTSEKPKFIKEDLCEECGSFDFLYKLDGRLICGECRDRM
ncbi:MAG: CBS domain-containing protein [Nanoarchaeota archaeon]|nr:CBS domain-containing protein [Nanoarchaeota archaeon]